MKSRTVNLLSTSSSSLLPAETYIYSITPIPRCAKTPSLAAISSDDSLRLFDCATLQPLASVLPLQHEGVTCLRPWGGAEADANSGGGADGSVLTAGRDGLVRGWDFRLGRGREKVLEMGGGSSHTISSSPPLLSLDSRDVYVATGAEFSNAQASVTVWDYRSTKSPLVQYAESHNDDITELQFHPTDPTRLLSGGMDGLINIYNITIVDEDDALIHIINHGSSISHAGFLSDTEIYALSHDESFTVQKLANPDEEPSSSSSVDQSRQVFGDLRSILKCDYIVDIVDIVRSSRPKEVIIGAGSHSHPENQYLDLVPLQFNSESQWSLTTNTYNNNNHKYFINKKYSHPENQYLDLVPLQFNSESQWSLTTNTYNNNNNNNNNNNKYQPIRIPNGHGSEIIRSFCFNHPTQSPQVLFTAGEDGLIRAWAIDGDGDEDEDDDLERNDKQEQEQDQDQIRDQGAGEKKQTINKKRKKSTRWEEGGNRNEHENSEKRKRDRS